jgi:hypothetical protein
MKSLPSLACFVTGIAMIAIVVPVAPVRYVLAQSGTHEDHYCNVTQEAHEYPVNIFCDSDVGHCNSTTKIHYYELGECVESTTGDTSCYDWSQLSYRIVPVNEKTGWKTPAELGLTGVAAAVCYYIGMVPMYIKGVSVPGVVVAVTCGLVTYYITDLNACAFITCTVDYTGPGDHGPYKTACSSYNTGF